MFRTCHCSYLSQTINLQVRATYRCPRIINESMLHLCPPSRISQFLDMTSTQGKCYNGCAPRNLNVILEFLLLLLWFVSSLPGHRLGFFADYCPVVEVEDEGSLLSLVVFECSVGHMCLVLQVSRIPLRFT